MENLLEQQARERELNKNEGENIEGKYSHIKGWGIDADPENEPTYPMKHYTGHDHQRSNYERPTLQPGSVELLKSNERATVSAVFGTSTPPSGLSGRLRRHAFKYSEGNWNHWITLLFADRVNMVEGIVADIKEGHFPNFFVERGWTAEWKYNRKNFVRNIAIGAAATIVLFKLVAIARRRIA